MIKGHSAHKLSRHPWNRPETFRGVKYVVDDFITIYPTLRFRNGFAYKSGKGILFSDIQETRNMMLRGKRRRKLYILDVHLRRYARYIGEVL